MSLLNTRTELDFTWNVDSGTAALIHAARALCHRLCVLARGVTSRSNPLARKHVAVLGAMYQLPARANASQLAGTQLLALTQQHKTQQGDLKEHEVWPVHMCMTHSCEAQGSETPAVAGRHTY